jgi:hypothetical protein
MNDFKKHVSNTKALLRMELPKMQSSALKHEYLTSVANVFNHPVAHCTDADEHLRVIGFANVDRTLPLVLILHNDNTVMHAFVPKPWQSPDNELLEALQHDEQKFTHEYAVDERQIAQYIRAADRRLDRKPDESGADYVNHHGLPLYSRALNISNDEEIRRKESWYDTTFYESDEAIDDHVPTPPITTKDRHILSDNVVESLDLGYESGEPKIDRVHLARHDESAGLSVAGPHVTPGFKATSAARKVWPHGYDASQPGEPPPDSYEVEL